MAVADAGRDSVHGSAVRHVAELELAADRLCERPQPLFATRQEHAVPPARGERARQVGADAGRGPGDDGDALR
jgi:hypothetical protein